MAEIAVLRTHIVNYAKTRETYVAYRKAGYSRKFREEHEEEILLHQAAKNAFDDMGVKKLPKVKDLQSEWSQGARVFCHRGERRVLRLRAQPGRHTTNSTNSIQRQDCPEEIDQLWCWDIKDAAYFTGGAPNQHGGGNLFAQDPEIMGWLFGQ